MIVDLDQELSAFDRSDGHVHALRADRYLKAKVLSHLHQYDRDGSLPFYLQHVQLHHPVLGDFLTNPGLADGPVGH